MPQKLQRPQGLPSAANDIPVIHQNTNATVLYATNLQPSERKRPKSPPEEGDLGVGQSCKCGHRPQGLPSVANNIPVIHQNANKEDDKKKGTTIAAVPFLCSFNA